MSHFVEAACEVYRIMPFFSHEGWFEIAALTGKNQGLPLRTNPTACKLGEMAGRFWTGCGSDPSTPPV